MNIFLIRHGQTIHNQSNTHQYSTTPLSDLGIQQTKNLAQRLQEAKIDQIYSSPLLRAKQTAEEVAALSGKNITFLDELREVKRPSVIEGKPHDDPIAVEIKKLIRENEAQPEWHHSDEENFWDVRQRVQTLMNRLEREKLDDIVLVTHGHVTRIFLGMALFGQDFGHAAFNRFTHHLSVSNTGISHCEYTSQGGWRVLRVNDTEHLNTL